MQVQAEVSTAYAAALAASGVFAVAAVATLVPIPAAGWPNLVGYRSLCSFAPISTALCWPVPAAVAVLLAAVIAAAAPAYARAHVDAGSGAWEAWRGASLTASD